MDKGGLSTIGRYLCRHPNLGPISDSFYNPYFGLEVDVYGDSQWAGAAIDAWYPNGQDNQEFIYYNA